MPREKKLNRVPITIYFDVEKIPWLDKQGSGKRSDYINRLVHAEMLKDTSELNLFEITQKLENAQKELDNYNYLVSKKAEEAKLKHEKDVAEEKERLYELKLNEIRTSFTKEEIPIVTKITLDWQLDLRNNKIRSGDSLLVRLENKLKELRGGTA